MVRFYDPKDEADLARVERVLRDGGIEFFTRSVESGPYQVEIVVAEEDVPLAEELVSGAAARE